MANIILRETYANGRANWTLLIDMKRGWLLRALGFASHSVSAYGSSAEALIEWIKGRVEAHEWSDPVIVTDPNEVSRLRDSAFFSLYSPPARI